MTIPLKEDGTLDIERIEQLPVEEHMALIGSLTSDQYDYYLSTLPDDDGCNCPRNIFVDYTLEDELKRGAVDADAYLKKMREKYLK